MKTPLLITCLIGVLLFAACAPAAAAPTPDVSLIQTSAAQTVMANFTLTAAALNPTALPPATDTPTLTGQTSEPGPTETPTVAPVIGTIGTGTLSLCDYYTWDSTVDVNVPDDTQMTPGQDFVKTWKIKNAGVCTWGAGYKVAYAGYADKMSGVPQAITSVVAPGQEVEISVNFKAPTNPGQYVSAWTLANATGRLFFGLGAKPLYVRIVVKL